MSVVTRRGLMHIEIICIPSQQELILVYDSTPRKSWMQLSRSVCKWHREPQEQQTRTLAAKDTEGDGFPHHAECPPGSLHIDRVLSATSDQYVFWGLEFLDVKTNPEPQICVCIARCRRSTLSQLVSQLLSHCACLVGFFSNILSTILQLGLSTAFGLQHSANLVAH